MTKFKATRGNQTINFAGNGARVVGYAASLELCGWTVTKI